MVRWTPLVVVAGAGLRDVRVADPESPGEVLGAVRGRCEAQAGQVPEQTYAGVRGPVVAGAEDEVGRGEPVPGPGDRDGRAQFQGTLDGGAILDRRVEADDDRHAHPDGLALRRRHDVR